MARLAQGTQKDARNILSRLGENEGLNLPCNVGRDVLFGSKNIAPFFKFPPDQR